MSSCGVEAVSSLCQPLCYFPSLPSTETPSLIIHRALHQILPHPSILIPKKQAPIDVFRIRQVSSNPHDLTDRLLISS